MKPAIFLLAITACVACQNGGTLFEKTDPASTGVAFANTLTETEQENILAFEYFYNGAGVATGDLNNDGRVDLYFTGNQVPNKLFLNQTEAGGTLKFADATARAGVSGRAGGWKTGVTLADVNADGWLDIYVCYSGLRPDSLRRNQLFINTTNVPGNPPTFAERAAAYGLADSGYSVQANFFDYDRDGDLDCFLINHNLKNYQRKEAAVMRTERDYNAGDKLFRNDGQNHFVDVSAAEGIKGNPLGFGLGVSVSDVNADGWPDVYVANDFVEDDYLYINQRGHTGTAPAFRDELRERIGHTSYSAMGVDVADVNNDALPDIFTLDMLPEDNARQKLLIWPDSWAVYQAQLKNGFWHQNMRNMLQINQKVPPSPPPPKGGATLASATGEAAPPLGAGGLGGAGYFSEVGQLAGVAATDWSWGALLADFDLDGRKDLFVSNGLGRDLTNADFTKYLGDQEQMQNGTSLIDQLKQMPSTPTKNYIFRNVSGPAPDSVAFQNRQAEWGFDENTRSNGCAYADLDNDGDLDLVTNNMNEPARLYSNTQRGRGPNHYLKLLLKGTGQNPFAIGTTVTVTQSTTTQVQEFYPTRGYLSCSHDALLFGLADATAPVQVRIRWPNGQVSEVLNPKIDQPLTVDFARAKPALSAPETPAANPKSTPVFQPVALDWTHRIAPANDFERQQMLPMQYSYTGPRIAVGDVNADGRADAYVCGTPQSPGTLLLNTGTGFTAQPVSTTRPLTNTDAVLADFDGDKRPDLFVVNGAYAPANLQTDLADQLWLNQNGTLTPAPLPPDQTNGSCVKALDVDRDGDLDLFVGGHTRPNRYPLAEESSLLLNDGHAHFTRQSLGTLGLVTDATVTDLNRDGWPDLLVVGEWMPVTVLTNQKGRLTPATDSPLKTMTGWWNRIEKADLDGDGDDDLVLANMGQNTQFRANAAEPATMVYEDFDQNGVLDCFMTYYIQGKAYPAHTRDEVSEQVTSLRRTFQTYAAYSTATLDQFFDPSVLERAQKATITTTRTLVLENRNGELIPHNLPQTAQQAPVFAILAEDVDRDGKPDLVLLGNNSHLRLRLGKVDANHGLVLRNRGNFVFETMPPTKTGLFLTGDVRDVKRAGSFVLVGQCDGPLRAYLTSPPR